MRGFLSSIPLCPPITLFQSTAASIISTDRLLSHAFHSSSCSHSADHNPLPAASTSTPTTTNDDSSPDLPAVISNFFQQQNNSDTYQLFRNHNFSLPLKGHIIAARVVQVTKEKVLVDPGYFGFCEFDRSQLSVEQLVGSTKRTQRRSRHDIKPGDYLKFKLEDYFSPYGDMQLQPITTASDVKGSLLWKELTKAYENVQPVSGRILNACNGGFAVGVGGYVCLLPFSRAQPETARLIGVVQQFYIERMVQDTRTVILRESKHADITSSADFYSNIPSQN